MTAIDFLNLLCSSLLVGLPVFLVLRFGIRGVIFGSLFFWLIGMGWSFARWQLAHIYTGFWLLLGFPAGFIYCIALYGILALALWTFGRLGWRELDRPVGAVPALGWAVVLCLLYWQCRPYGMGTSTMIESVEHSPQNVVGFVWNEPWYFHNFGGIDLEKGTYQIGGSDESDNEFGSITLTCGGATTVETALSADKIAKIRQLLQMMPHEHKLFFQRYDFTRNIYVTYWSNGSREILAYRRSDLPEDVASLFRVLSPHVLDEVEGKED